MKTQPDFIIIDDESLNNVICKYQIARVYDMADVKIFTDPHKALLYLTELIGKPISKTIVFLDINMPGLTGWELISEFEASGKIPHDMLVIYMLSSSIDPRDHKLAKENPNIVGFINKPLTSEILQSI